MYGDEIEVMATIYPVRERMSKRIFTTQVLDGKVVRKQLERLGKDAPVPVKRCLIQSLKRGNCTGGLTRRPALAYFKLLLCASWSISRQGYDSLSGNQLNGPGKHRRPIFFCT